MVKSMKPAFAGLLALGLAACAGAPPQVADNTPAQAQAQAKASAKKDCVRETGTRIKAKEGKCAPVDGRVYTDEDLERSGATTLNEAINRLGR